MGRKLTFIACLAFSVSLARQASAIPVTPVDLDTLTTGSPLSSTIDVFNPSGSSSATGELESSVFLNGPTYLYTQTVVPTGNFNFLFNTQFEVIGFTGVAGWRFSDAAFGGATGTASDFMIEAVDGRLIWVASLGGAFGEWNAFEPITFFFSSTTPPTIKNYDLFSLMPISLGTAQGLAPVPEPGSIALFGSGLVGLFAALRRRRAAKT